ncbi:RagB/SusD family nutrient uptake outer membrane protein [Fulvivirgaceae bacterium BMA10]|uniref:RagB/SusD family nutrient uptake outer membrane protein n=1 Tax=Splendidivirga corallicola TaxID=3051826 RepID=A0ABT8KMZ4_9BACT|nr:RagB/SusD family nutrient uptake outer membrane protein [Fulvivirgaceae bacterium BMA10]
MKNFRYIWSIPVLMALLFFGCEDILDKQPPGKLSESSFWQTENDALAGIAAVYDALETPRAQMGWGHMGFFDSFTPIANCRGGSLKAFSAGTYDASTSVARHLWENSYKGVVRANDFLANVDRIDMDADLKTRLTGEARFLRAMYYYLLVEHFGDVPLFETVPTVDDALAERAPRAKVIELMKQDIQFAIDNLESSYSGDDLGRATIGSATALRVKLALLEKDWGTAADAAEQIMGMGYDLLPNYQDVFSVDQENSVEVIFDIQHIFMSDAEPGGRVEKLYAPRGATASGWSTIQPNLYLVEKFEVIDPNPTYVQEDARIPTEIYDYFEGRDPRMDYTIIRPGAHFIEQSGDKLHPYEMTNRNNTQTGFWARKYVIEGPIGVTLPNNSPLNWIIFRYSDILLNYLEAVAERDGIGAVTQTVLDQTINKVRARASDQLPLYTAGAITMEDIRDERIRELALEGWLYSDMKRWQTLETEIYHPKTGVGLKITNETIELGTSPVYPRVFESPKNYLMPIPQDERDVNPNLTQNTGYPE